MPQSELSNLVLHCMKDRITKISKTTGASGTREASEIVKSGKSKFQKANYIKGTATKKGFFHIRSKHKGNYEFEKLIAVHEKLEKFVRPNKYGTDSIDFSDPQSVKELNTAILKLNYDLKFWDIPSGYLCPPIPSRADYIHHVADLFGDLKPIDELKLKCFDIGAGANCIYPIIGAKVYNWEFIASDIDRVAIENMELIIEKNPELKPSISPRFQDDSGKIFSGVLGKSELIDLVVCNPPFHETPDAASKATTRKFKNLGLGSEGQKAILNFGGKPSELWTFGGEKKFIHSIITESVEYKESIMWFTSLVSKKESINPLKKALSKVNPAQVKVIKMNQGNKSSRVLAWTFMDDAAQTKWLKSRFGH